MFDFSLLSAVQILNKNGSFSTFSKTVTAFPEISYLTVWNSLLTVLVVAKYVCGVIPSVILAVPLLPMVISSLVLTIFNLLLLLLAVTPEMFAALMELIVSVKSLVRSTETVVTLAGVIPESTPMKLFAFPAPIYNVAPLLKILICPDDKAIADTFGIPAALI